MLCEQKKSTIAGEVRGSINFEKNLLMHKTFLLVLIQFLIWIHPLMALPHDDSTRLSPDDYIKKYKSVAIKHMKEYGIPASITLAQGILESGFGNSKLAREANNHFGIKCHNGWTGDTYYKDDDKKNECFRKYQSAEASFRDHALFLTSYNRYSFLFDLKTTDYKGWARGLKKAGYATNSEYPKKLISLIERYALYEYDKQEPNEKRGLFFKNRTGLQDPDDNKVFSVIVSGRAVRTNNNVKYIILKEGEALTDIADGFDIRPWLLRSYNDLDKNTIPGKGDTLYIQPKRRKASVPYHIVKEGDTMRSISQQYAVKLKQLYKKNNLSSGNEPKAGDQIWLQKRKPKD
jgi:hypothetical protein